MSIMRNSEQPDFLKDFAILCGFTGWIISILVSIFYFSINFFNAMWIAGFFFILSFVVGPAVLLFIFFLIGKMNSSGRVSEEGASGSAEGGMSSKDEQNFHASVDGFNKSHPDEEK